ncbi:hypothetical protein GCM10010840_04960 [Deinococcus aerolatus]|uniref:Obg domain-containing protein n=1 Tax=Deinococcus aerolatus TaxID=522487 RepID=A0ABQ2G199_9DEIO|nr:hypothetical protein GCM10010840_04960 [Deinococcus aerolatus]
MYTPKVRLRRVGEGGAGAVGGNSLEDDIRLIFGNRKVKKMWPLAVPQISHLPVRNDVL